MEPSASTEELSEPDEPNGSAYLIPLPSEIVAQIKQDYVDKNPLYHPIEQRYYGADDVCLRYYGTYNGCLAIKTGYYGTYCVQMVFEFEIDGVLFAFTGSPLFVWKGGIAYSLSSAYEQELLTKDDLVKIASNDVYLKY